ncbi:MAG: prepilin-type N-terminal cleavage/methylation domain-containing protein [Victivallaceae bacterium]|nr:prepilin-type N-terminal cleavage/methylation domain-containing protein [Victivallaceae bacterium]
MGTKRIHRYCLGWTKGYYFTLIELIIVIMIIALLAAMILPAIGKAHEQSKRSGCLSNLKQLALGLFLYADDHNEKLPASASGLKVLCDTRYIVPKIFLCPSDRLNRISLIDNYFHNRDNSISASYHFVNYYRSDDEKLSMLVPRPAKYALEWDLYGGSYDSANAKKRNHAINGGNVIFFDSHAVWVYRPLWFKKNKPVYMP